jgi:hypothetical protein
LGNLRQSYSPFVSAPLQQPYSTMIASNYVAAPNAINIYGASALWPSKDVAASAELATEVIASSYPATLVSCLAATAPRPLAELDVRPTGS